jgi:hypothetical protein
MRLHVIQGSIKSNTGSLDCSWPARNYLDGTDAYNYPTLQLFYFGSWYDLKKEGNFVSTNFEFPHFMMRK